jgi:hypothetical protein
VARPRFLLVLGHQIGGRFAPPWPGLGRTVAELPADGAWVAWRLLGSNHREVARSASVFPDVTACLAAIGIVRDALAAHTTQLRIEAVGGLWSWVLTIDDVASAVASRPYQRQRECDYNCHVFLAAAPAAVLVVSAPSPRQDSVSGTVVAAE